MLWLNRNRTLLIERCIALTDEFTVLTALDIAGPMLPGTPLKAEDILFAADCIEDTDLFMPFFITF